VFKLKKTFLIFALILFSVVLMSCDRESEIVDPIDLDVNVKLVELEDTIFNVHVVVPIQVENMNDLMEITLDIARQMYTVQAEEIGTNMIILTVYLYKNEGDYNLNDATYGYHEFTINASQTEPGLSLGSSHLKLN
jgi:hypothetical protein